MLLFPLAPAPAQDITSTFVPPTAPLVAGQRASLWLYCMNNSSNQLPRAFEPSLNGTLRSADATNETVLTLNAVTGATEVVIAPGSFVRQEYLLDVPPTILGHVDLVISHYNELALDVEAPSSAASLSPPGREQRGGSSSPTNGPYVADVIHHFSPYLSPYEPIYFIFGTQPAARFQFSLKYQLFNVPNPPPWLPVNGQYFAYTQTSLWSIFARSSAFYDTSYKPSGFTYLPRVLDLHGKIPLRLDLQTGYEHESNGRGTSSQERAMNTLYLQPTLTFGPTNDWNLCLQPRAWLYICGLPDNPNMPEYHGYANLLTTLSWKELQLAAKFGIGDEGTHPGLQLDLRYHLPRLFHRFGFNPALQLQYFSGYGQSLRQYNRLTHAVRGGISLYDSLPTPD
ncbi:MAG TPA: phospholipase A [Verrucomicrobiae bacterium]|nr:phospholipase A [Verrucomicrobiae bacterium]